jgi:hypothetical protein
LPIMVSPKIQWHPLLGRLLRHHVEGYYELLTNLPVGDLPRQADFVLLRRTESAAPPFSGLWRHLTAWNVLEYKGPTVTPRKQHLPLLVEVGLGINRRLHAGGAKQGVRPTPEPEVSFWYLANSLGRRFLEGAASRMGRLDAIGQGVWKSAVLGHPCFLVSAADLPVDEDSLPLHLLGLEPLEQQVEVGQFVIEVSERLEAYGGLFAALHPAAWKEVKAMARTKRAGLQFDLRPIVEELGLEKLIEQIGKKEVIEQIGKKEVIKQIGKKDLLAQMDVDDILKNLPPAKRRELLRRVNAETKSPAK